MENVKESRDGFLGKVLTKELKRLKKLVFKYKNRNLLEHKLEVIIGDLSYIDASGLCETIKGTDPYDYSHKITINEKYIDLCFESTDKYMNPYYKRLVRRTVIHELCHALSYELYDDMSELDGVHCDASPIFLCLLYFCGGKTSHDCKKAFIKSKAFIDTRTMKTFKELNIYLLKQLIQYDRVVASLKTKITFNTFTTNTFTFASRNSGLLANISIQKTVKMTDIKQTLYVTYNTFEIGACILPQDIEKFVDKKIKSRKFEVKKSEYIYKIKNVEYSMNNGQLNKRIA